jgi:hypothetical protein
MPLEPKADTERKYDSVLGQATKRKTNHLNSTALAGQKRDNIPTFFRP